MFNVSRTNLHHQLARDEWMAVTGWSVSPMMDALIVSRLLHQPLYCTLRHFHMAQHSRDWSAIILYSQTFLHGSTFPWSVSHYTVHSDIFTWVNFPMIGQPLYCTVRHFYMAQHSRDRSAIILYSQTFSHGSTFPWSVSHYTVHSDIFTWVNFPANVTI